MSDPAKPEVPVLAELPPPEGLFVSDNAAGAHPDVVAAIVAANHGQVPGYGADEVTAAVIATFAELFDRPVEVALAFGGTGANVVALHAVAGPGTVIVCGEEAHILRHEAGAPARLTGATLVTLPSPDGKVTPGHVRAAAAGLGGSAQHVLSISQATELGTIYQPDELADVCGAAHDHGLVVHVDGARLANALVAWGAGPADLQRSCRQLADCGADVVVVGGTKAGMFGAEAVVFCEPSLAEHVAERRKQAGQTASKMRFLAAQYAAALDGGRILGWASTANAAAGRLARRLEVLPGVELVQPVETNLVFCRLPLDAVDALRGWTPCPMWDAATGVLRFVTSWDTSDDDVDRLAAGIAAAVG